MDLDTYLVLILLVSVCNSIGMDRTILKLDASSDLGEIGLSNVLVKPYVVDLLLHVLRVSQLRSEVTIVGKEKHASGVAVETTYWIDALLAGIANKIHDGLTALWIVAGSYGILWFVEQYIDLALKAYRLVVEENDILAGYLSTELGYYLAIDLDATVGDIIIGLAT